MAELLRMIVSATGDGDGARPRWTDGVEGGLQLYSVIPRKCGRAQKFLRGNLNDGSGR